MKKINLFILASAFFFQIQAQVTLTVDPSKEYQTMVGMGGHGINNDANYIKYLVDYLGITAYRHWIECHGVNDTYVTIANIDNGTVAFKDVDANAISFFTTLRNKGVNTVIATCWSPPGCLKKNNCIQQRAQAVVDGPWICGQPCQKPMCENGYNSSDPDNILLPEHYGRYARYLALWAKDFQTKTGTNLYAISIQNEPLFNEPYASAQLYSSAYGPSLQAVHDTFAKYNDLKNIKFFGPEHMSSYPGNSSGSGSYIQDVIDNATYKPYLDAYAVHGYSDGIASDLGSSNEWSSFASKIVTQNSKMMWMTETSGEGTDWTSGYGYMKSMFLAIKYGKVSLWTYWGMGGMYSSGSPQRNLYNHMHYYRFIKPGMKMIDVSDTDTDVEAVGFKNGNDVTVVVVNSSTKNSKTISFSDFAGKPAFYHVYRSSSTEMCAYVGKITDNTFVLPKQSVVTITYNSANPDYSYGPKSPLNLRTTSVGDNSITVAWDPSAAWTLAGSSVGITGYSVYIDGVKKTVDGPTTKLTWTFTGLKKNTQYNIQIISRDAMINESVASSINAVTTCSTNDCGPIVVPISIDESNASFSVSPNPSSDIIRVSLPENSYYQIVLVNISGQVVSEWSNISDGGVLDISSIPAGVYIVVAKGNDSVLKAKIIKE